MPPTCWPPTSTRSRWKQPISTPPKPASPSTTTADDLLAKPPAAFDVILVGDLFYERQLADAVLTFIDAASKAGALILIGDPQRNYFPKGRFTLAHSYEVAVTRELEDALIKKTAVWRA